MHRLARLCLAHRWVAGAALVAVTALLVAGLPRVRPEFGYRVLIGDTHPAVQRLDAFIERFGGGLPIQIGWECGAGEPCAHVLDADSMRMARAITDELGSADGVLRVTGPPNAPLLAPSPGGFSLRRFVERGRLAADAEMLAELAVSDPLWREVLVSRDGTAAAIVVQPTDSRAETSERVSEAVLRAVAPHREAGFHFHLSGDPIQNGIVGRDLADSTARLIPFTVLIVGLILLVFSRSLSHAAIALATMGLALAWTFGLLGWLGWPQDGILEVLAPVILVVGVCDSVHLLAKYADLRAADPTRDVVSSLREAATRVSGPCAITTLTTTAAFLSFTTSDLATFHRFGAIAAFGSLACLVLTFSLLPLLVAALAPKPASAATATSRKAANNWTVLLDSILDVSERRAFPILLVSTVVVSFCAIGWGLHLEVDHEWKESLGEHSEVVRAWRFMEERIGHSDTLEIEVELPADWPLEAPQTLARLELFSRFLAGLDELRTPRSILDVIERVNRLLHPAERSALPRTAAASAEILELIAFDDPGLLAQWVSFDRSQVRISVGAPEQAFSTRARLLANIREFADAELPESWTITPNGRVAIQFSWIRAVQATQLRSFPTALLLVFVLVAAFLRSARLGLAALVPTGLPIVITLGAMGWSGMTLDVGRAMIAAIVLGIGVDDSIHLLDRYRARRIHGDAPDAAIREAVRHCGRAVVTTSVALSLGFLTLMASAWQSISTFGFLVAIAILGALVSSLFVLPALIFACSRRPPRAGGPPRPLSPRSLVVFAVSLPVIVCLALAARQASDDRRAWALPCWLLPAAHVLTLPGSGTCGLELLDQVRWVEDTAGNRFAVDGAAATRRVLADAGPAARLGISRRGQSLRVDTPLDRQTALRRAVRVGTAGVVAVSLLLLPGVILLRSRARAAIPLAIFYSAIGVALVPALSGQHSAAIDAAAVAALAVAPAALLHLAMVFPTESRAVRLAPRLQGMPYAPCCVLGAVALVALEHSPILWPTLIYLALALDGVAWIVLLTACAFAARDGRTPFERARARFVLATSLTLPAGAAALLSWNGAPVEQAATYLAASALVIPLPIGFAIGRYDLFDLGWHARRGAARAVYLVSGSLAVATLLRGGARLLDSDLVPDFGIAFTTSLLCLITAEAVRQPLLGLLDSALSPRIEALRALRDARVEQLSALQDESEAARLVLESLGEGLRAEASWLFLRAGSDWELAACTGSPPEPSRATVAAIATKLARRPVAVPGDALDCEDAPAWPETIELAAAIRHGDELLGVLLARCGPRPAPLSSFEFDFVAALCGQAAVSIHSVRLAEERAAVERHTTTARVALELMHDLGKDLGWMKGLASRVRRSSENDPRTREGAAELDVMARDLVARLRAFVDDATTRLAEPPEVARLDELLARCADALRTRLGTDLRVGCDPSLRSVRCPEYLRRTLTRSLGDQLARALPTGPLLLRAEVDARSRLRVRVISDDGEQAGVRLVLPELDQDLNQELGTYCPDVA